MAVSALPRTRSRAPNRAATVAPAVLGLTLVAPALDVLAYVQPSDVLGWVGVASVALAGAALLAVWVRHFEASWLAAASMACFASLAMRVVGADVAPLLSLLTVIALGLGGAFASPASEPDALLV